MDWDETDRGKAAQQYKELCTQINNTKKGNDIRVKTILTEMSHTKTFSEHYLLIR